MVEIENFSSAAQSVRDDAHIALTGDRARVTTRSGRLARWIGNLRTGENRAVSDRFAESLRARYGSDPSRRVLTSGGLDRPGARPLRARQVREAIHEAEAQQANLRRLNEQLARLYSRLEAGPALIQVKINDAVQRRFPRDTTAMRLVDANALAPRLGQAIIAAGKDGKRLVTNDEAAGIVANVVSLEVERAYRTLDAALARMSLEDPDSIASRALDAAAAARNPPLQLDRTRLTPDARGELAARLEARFASSPDSALLKDDTSLRALADRTMTEFVEERAAAGAAADGLRIVGPQARAAMREEAVHDHVPARVVNAMDWDYAVVEGKLSALGTALTPQELEETVRGIHGAMEHAISDSRLADGANDPDALCRSAWRLFLAPGGIGQAAAIASQWEPAESPLRALGDGAQWYRQDFRGTPKAAQTFRSWQGRLAGWPIYRAETFQTADQYAVMLGGLGEVAAEKIGTGHAAPVLTPRRNLPDQAISTLRSLGISMPPPDRMGEENPDAPVSAPGFAAVRQALAEHMSSDPSRRVLTSGGLDRPGARPLRARQVREAIHEAEAQQANLRRLNEQLARLYSRLEAGPALIQVKINDAVQRRFPRDTTAMRLVDANALAPRLGQAIIAAGKDGKRLVTNDEAAGIVANVVSLEVERAYRTLDAALARMSLEDPDSIASRALDAAAAARNPPLQLDRTRLTPDARGELAARLEARFASSPDSALLKDDTSLRALADRTMTEFVEERAAAGAAADGLRIVGPQARAAMREEAVHDHVPARVVNAMDWDYAVVEGKLSALGTALTPQELEETVRGIHGAMEHAISDSRLADGANDPDALCRSAWRLFLAPGGIGQATAIASQWEPAESPLRALGNGAQWYRQDFRGTPKAAQTFRSWQGRLAGWPIYRAETFQTADQYAVMLGGLGEVAAEKIGTGHAAPVLTPRRNLPDQAISTLRSLGISMPPPDRMGEENPDAPVSAPGFAAVRQALAEHMSSERANKLEDGISRESITDFNRGTYRIAGLEIPRTKKDVSAALREFCTDEAGNPTPGMLKSVSMLAYQAGPGCAVDTVLNPERSDIAVLDGLPAFPDSREFNISRDEQGDVLVNCVLSGPIARIDRQDAKGYAEPVFLDTSESNLRVAVHYRIDAASFEPSLEDVRIGYSLQSISQPRADAAAPEAPASDER